MITETTTLVDFLLARIAEDEAEARRELSDGYGDMHRCESGWPSGRVLAECDAKRRIVTGDFTMGGREDDYDAGFDGGAENAQQSILRLLALPHANHPDYDQAWRP